MNPRRFILVPLGSAGDVNPMTWLAKLLAARGHDVVVVAQALVADIPRRAGLRTLDAGSVEEQEAVTRDPDLWHPTRAFGFLARRFPGWAREMLPLIRQELVPGRTVLVGAGIAFAARIAAEAWRVPLVTVQLQPSVFLSVDDTPLTRPGFEWLRAAPRWVRRAFFAVAHREVDRHLARPLNVLRAELGLQQPVRGIMRDWWMSPDRVLALFPGWFAPPQRDWPAQTVLTRFPLYDGGERQPGSPELERFLESGPPPILVTPGSANRLARVFLVNTAEACFAMGRRALFVTRFRDQLPPGLGAGMFHVEFAPFSRIFRRCAAVVHHGGIGTCAQGLAAGVPQFLMPMSHDQPDNATRLKRMGVGDYLYPRQFTAERIAARLTALLGNTEVAEHCRNVMTRMAAQMPPEQVAEILEAVAT